RVCTAAFAFRNGEGGVAMRGPWYLLAALGLLAGLGCLSTLPEQVPTTWKSWRWPQEDLVAVEAAILRLPSTDPFANRGLWREVDELVLPLEKRLSLEANGFRTGIISGNVPADLQRLLTDKNACITSRRVAVRPGRSYFLAVAQQDRDLNVQVVEQGEAISQEFEQARCGLSLRLESDEETTRISCEPCVRHGRPLRLLRPTEDRSDWDLQSSRPEKCYPSLAWDLKITSAEYGVVGCLVEREHSLGYHSLVEAVPGATFQHLIVFRRVPRLMESSTALTRTAPRSSGNEPPPLAQQSVTPPRLPLTRGQSP
ncbi:MAG: hypothetical protein NZM31_06875, partial [Gemmatales bacterium]|nr:hypothetical protein [Gemmatales bacterium]MDW8386724.1 hypothetical protein [Gemmatales bacterium]